MKIYAFALLISITFIVADARPQVCGGGVREYEIFVRNGVNAEKLRYEVFAVMPVGVKDEFEATAKYLDQTFFPGKKRNPSRFWIYEPQRVKGDVAERFLAKYRAEEYQKEPEDEPYFRENKRTGAAAFGEIRFKTRELYDQPLLLKVFADNYKPVYLLGDHFGGCSKAYKILLEDHFLPGT